MIRMIRIIILLVTFSATLVSADYGFGMLRIPLGPKTSALAGAGTAWPGEIFSFYYNPASLPLLPTCMGVDYRKWIADIHTARIAFNYNIDNDWGFGFIVSHLVTEFNSYDLAGNVIADGTLAPQETLFQAAYGLSLSEKLSVGAAISLGMEDLYEAQIMTSASFNAGILCSDIFKVGDFGLDAGLVVRNAGYSFKMKDYQPILPVIALAGVNVKLPLGFFVPAEAGWMAGRFHAAVGAGWELDIKDVGKFGLYGGVPFTDDLRIWSAGASVEIRVNSQTKVGASVAYEGLRVDRTFEIGLTYLTVIDLPTPEQSRPQEPAVKITK